MVLNLTICYHSPFIITFIIINDSVPNEGKVLCLGLALKFSIWQRFGEEPDLQCHVEFMLSRPESMPVGAATLEISVTVEFVRSDG